MQETLLNNIALIVLALLQGWAMWRAKQNHARSHKEINEVKQATTVIQNTVDGPLGTALATAATALEALARLTQDEGKIMEAIAARKLSDQHIENGLVAAEARKKTEEEKTAIIEEFLAKGKSKPVD
jgi:hypothetical protein